MNRSILRHVEACPVPAGSLLDAHRLAGSYTDCFVAEMAGDISTAQFVEAFYTTPLFRLERLLLTLVFRPSSDAAARQLASGQRGDFAAWQVEQRRADELLMAAGRTRSWLQAAPSAEGTCLHFGSAIVPARGSAPGGDPLGSVFRALLDLHLLYSRALLRAACRRLTQH
ncbi:hypothetical protein [Solimonas sp. SE-A11]|uniref:hypothetical protein n=1 Tax=Solimonas sp. SE-A11 TaxID=3054954 RepID=UPI00259C8B46|nr:hypothetical protein [Solimonas sp. SE-A11]MDM4770959.1 hypothetical protein [Solimonas sp. SE-A11]